jgi:hypothetical protein
MKRNLFVLVLSLMLLSFGLSFAQDTLVFRDTLSGTGAYISLGVVKINPNNAFFIDTYANNTTANRVGGGFSCEFYGTNNVTTVVWASGTGAGFTTAAWDAKWTMLNSVGTESWDGNLATADLWANSVATTGDPWWTDGEHLIYHMGCTVTNSDTLADGTVGQFCIRQGNPINPDLGWLFTAPVPVLDTKCWTVAPIPNMPPEITNCPLQLTKDFNESFSYQFLATDEESDDITFAKVSGPGGVTEDGLWTWSPSCGDVGESFTLVVCAGDAMHACPGGGLCTVDIVVTNDAPVIGGACGTTVNMGMETKTAQFTVADGNDNQAAKTWEIVSVTPALHAGSSYGISATGLLTFTIGNMLDLDINYDVVVRVTDCAGASDECTITFHVISQFPFTIKIQKVEDQLQGHHAYVEVTKEAGSEEMWGFDFLIAYDASALSFMGAIESAIFNIPPETPALYQWEYFNYRYGPDGNCGSACPSGMLRVIAIADQNDGGHHPITKILPNGTLLFKLDFLVSNNRTYECMYVPIYFYWMDCGDNTIAFRYRTDETGYDIQTAVNDYIYNYNGTYYDIAHLTDTTYKEKAFPSVYGVNSTCFVPVEYYNEETQQYELKPLPIRFINFYNGGIDIICAEDIDARGDINLNNVMNEIGDAVVFTNYFIAGLAAFTVNEEGQIAATDVNADGITLSVADLVYLIRVIVGDAVPYAKLSPNTNTASFGSNGSVVTVDAELGAAYFVFAGDVSVSLADGAAGMEIKTGFDGKNTRALVYSFEKGRTFSGNILNTTGTIVSVEAADYNGSALKTHNLPTAFSVKNYPNPFNPTTTIAMSLPVASDWSLTVYNVAGQKVYGQTGHSNAGVVNVTFDASNLGSGIYFYKVEAGKNSMTKKMVLLK